MIFLLFNICVFQVCITVFLGAPIWEIAISKSYFPMLEVE
jgi:hypothetical protein